MNGILARKNASILTANSRIAKADDMILEVARNLSYTSPEWVYFGDGVTSQAKGTTENSNEYFFGINSGRSKTVVSGATSVYTLAGVRVEGDELQDWLFDYSRTYDFNNRKVPFRYYSAITGLGIKGWATIMYSETDGGDFGSDKSFAITLTEDGLPEEICVDIDDGSEGIGVKVLTPAFIFTSEIDTFQILAELIGESEEDIIYTSSDTDSIIVSEDGEISYVMVTGSAGSYTVSCSILDGVKTGVVYVTVPDSAV